MCGHDPYTFVTIKMGVEELTKVRMVSVPRVGECIDFEEEDSQVYKVVSVVWKVRSFHPTVTVFVEPDESKRGRVC
jgi:hypothetical protein